MTPRLAPLLIAGAALLLAALASAVPGASGAYVAKITTTTNSVGSAPYFTCAAAAKADQATAVFQLPLTEADGATVAADANGNRAPGAYQGAMTTQRDPSACTRDGGTAYVLDGSSSYVSSSAAKITDPTTFTLEVWFKTSTPTGKLIGFGSSQTGSSTHYDRHLYITDTGLLTFGIYMSGRKTISTTTVVTDNTWHHAVATLAPAGTANPGMTLYLDGRQAAVGSAYTTPQTTSGWWRIGYDNQTSWPSIGVSPYFTGAMRYAAVYTTAFTPAQVAEHFTAGR